MTTKRAKGSIEGNSHPYMRDSFWIQPENQFWHKRCPEPIMRYNVQAYDKILAKWIKQHRNYGTL